MNSANRIRVPDAVARQDLHDALLDISNLVGSVMPLQQILAWICRISAKALQTDTCTLYLREDAVDRDQPGTRRLVCRATFGLRQELIDRGAFDFGQGIPGWAAERNKTTAVRDARQDPRYAQLDDADDEDFVAYLCVPLRVQNEIIGVMSVRRREPTDWTEDDAVIAEIVAKQVAIVIEKARLYQDKIDAEKLAAVAISLSETAHSIKNMLHGMSGGEYIVEQGIDAGDLARVRRGWEILKRNQVRIQRLVANMLSFSSSRDLTRMPAEVNSVVSMIVEEVRDTAELRGIRLDFVREKLLPRVLLDPTAFHDAIMNLVTNALDAIEEGRVDGEVLVATRYDRDRGTVTIAVRDNGVGIPEEARGRLYQLFFTTKGRAGTGIGLCVTKKIIEELGGRIDFTSEVNIGTEFRVELPMIEE
ncbi:MAG: GAF domain-containing sensor histidine kinase [Candidatus Sumerlaeia bacterium]|nr:GAF domain-containing sensor histidine kinase [Candidatus Sumerlaeia bacterium]